MAGSYPSSSVSQTPSCLSSPFPLSTSSPINSTSSVNPNRESPPSVSLGTNQQSNLSFEGKQKKTLSKKIIKFFKNRYLTGPIVNSQKTDRILCRNFRLAIIWLLFKIGHKKILCNLKKTLFCMFGRNLASARNLDIWNYLVIFSTTKQTKIAHFH